MDLRHIYRLIRNDYSDSNLAGIYQFLESGGDPNYEVYSGITVFHEAVCFLSDNIAVVRALINAGADVNSSSNIGYTPLMHAVLYRKRSVVDALIESGASVNAKDFLGKTVLHHAVCKCVLQDQISNLIFNPDVIIIEKLLKHESINCNSMDSNGETPLMIAIKDQQFEIANLLLSKNANPNLYNNFSETPLHMAFSQPPNYTEIKLLHHGANIYFIDKKGQTPFDILLKSDLHLRIIDWMKLLLKAIAFKYFVTSDLKRKFELIPNLWHHLNKCCDEVGYMRGDFISGNITMHDFVFDCFDENDFKFLLLQIHKPVVES